MPPLKHSPIGASGAVRWMNCPGSVRLTKDLPNQSSVYAAEGTAAHAFVEDCYRKKIAPASRIGTTIEGFPVTKEMAESAEVYIKYLNEASASLETEPVIEQQFCLDWIDERLFGTSDAAIMQTMGTVEVIDFKYGKGVAVSPEWNAQLMYYALGIVGEYNIESFSTVRLTIVQPRADHDDGVIRSWELPVEVLIKWAEEKLIPAVKATDDPDAALNPGAAQCRFCDASSRCPAKLGVATSTSLVTAADVFAETPVTLPPVDLLSDEQIAKVYEFSGLLKNWITNVQKQAKERMSRGEAIEGLKLIAGRSTRSWMDPEAAERKLKRMLGASEAMTKTVLSPAQAEKKLGADKAKIQKLIRVDHGQSVVLESDKRPALQVETADKAFA